MNSERPPRLTPACVAALRLPCRTPTLAPRPTVSAGTSSTGATLACGCHRAVSSQSARRGLEACCSGGAHRRACSSYPASGAQVGGAGEMAVHTRRSRVGCAWCTGVPPHSKTTAQRPRPPNPSSHAVDSFGPPFNASFTEVQPVSDSNEQGYLWVPPQVPGSYWLTSQAPGACEAGALAGVATAAPASLLCLPRLTCLPARLPASLPAQLPAAAALYQQAAGWPPCLLKLPNLGFPLPNTVLALQGSRCGWMWWGRRTTSQAR